MKAPSDHLWVLALQSALPALGLCNWATLVTGQVGCKLQQLEGRMKNAPLDVFWCVTALLAFTF